MRYFIILMISTIFTGCTHYAPPGENHPVRVVTQVDVTATQDGQLHHYRYRDSQRMGAILQYLRNIEPLRYSPITPDTFRTDAYEIILTMSDGTKTVYHQIYDSYLQKDNGPWQSIENSFGGSLPQLLKILTTQNA